MPSELAFRDIIHRDWTTNVNDEEIDCQSVTKGLQNDNFDRQTWTASSFLGPNRTFELLLVAQTNIPGIRKHWSP